MANHLVFQTAFIGDVLLSIPLLKSIKKYKPNDKLHLFCRPALVTFFKKLDFVDEVFAADKSSSSAWKNSLKPLLQNEYEAVFCPHESFRSAKAVKKIKAKNKVGYHKWWNAYFFNVRLQRPMEFPEAVRQMFLLSAVDANFRMDYNKWILEAKPTSHIGQDSYKLSKAILPDFASMQVLNRKSINDPGSGSKVGVAPGSVWNTKKWTKYLQLVQQLIRSGHYVTLLGSKDELEICNEIEQAVGKSPFLDNRCGEGDLWKAFEVLRDQDILVCNDSGLMHLASAAGTPTVAIFGPTTPALGYEPWSENAYLVQKPLSCRPCGLHGHKVCPIGTHECMTSVSVSEVSQAIKNL